MTYLDYVVLFDRLDQERPFSLAAARLYHKLLALFNGKRGPQNLWPEVIAKADPYVAEACGFTVNTMKTAREQLTERGLLGGEWGKKGSKSAGTYRLLCPAEKLSNFDSLPEVKPSEIDSLEAEKLSEIDSLPPENIPKEGEKLSEKLSNFDTPYKKEEKEESIGAALAATLTLPSADKKANGKGKPKTTGATAEEIAAIVLPHHSPEVASLWATFATGPKQAGKPVSALDLMARKLGKYPEAFAVVMLEAAIQGNWSGIENPGTGRAFAEWQAQHPAQAAAPASAPPAEELNQEFITQQEEARVAARRARLGITANALQSCPPKPPRDMPPAASRMRATGRWYAPATKRATRPC